MTDQTLGSLDGAPANDQLEQRLTQPSPAVGAQLERPARVPLGWLPSERGELFLASPNPSLKVVANFNGPLPNGMPGFGFGVAVAASFVQVVCFQNRYVLRDGYHRAFGLLSRGITSVPAFIRDFDTAENLAPAGMLPHSAWLGQRPPVLRDYHDDLVSESVNLPAQHRMIVIHALELSALG